MCSQHLFQYGIYWIFNEIIYLDPLNKSINRSMDLLYCFHLLIYRNTRQPDQELLYIGSTSQSLCWRKIKEAGEETNRRLHRQEHLTRLPLPRVLHTKTNKTLSFYIEKEKQEYFCYYLHVPNLISLGC